MLEQAKGLDKLEAIVSFDDIPADVKELAEAPPRLFNDFSIDINYLERRGQGHDLFGLGGGWQEQCRG